MTCPIDSHDLSRIGMAGRRGLLSGNALAAASMLAWSAGFPAAEILLKDWAPEPLIAARLMLAVAILMPLWILSDGFAMLRRARWRHGLMLGGMSFGLGALFLLKAQALTDPVTVALIASASPLAATVLEMAQRSRRLTPGFVLGLAASVIGGAVATGGAAAVDPGLGAAYAIGSVFLFAWGSMKTVQDFPDLSPLGRSTVTLAGGMVLMAQVVAVRWLAGAEVMPRGPISADALGLLVIYAVAGMALSQVMWIASVGRLGVAVASFHINLAPFHVMIIMLFLGGAWDWRQAAGAAIVGLGVVMAQGDGMLRPRHR